MIHKALSVAMLLVGVIVPEEKMRFRPIMLTSLTTFLGLTPLMLEKSMQARFLIPMAVALAFGVVFSTAISLMIVPCVYLILTDVKRGMRVALRMDRSQEQPMEQDDTEKLEPAAASSTKKTASGGIPRRPLVDGRS